MPEQSRERQQQVSDLFFALFNANPIPTALISLESHRFLNANEEFLNYFGLQLEEIVNHGAHEFNFSLGVEPMLREEWLSQIQRSGRIRNHETTILHPSGEMRNILASVQVIELVEKEALIATFIDITERVHTEQQNRALAAELTATEQTERHRLAQILHDDLQQRIFAVQMQLSFLKDAYDRNDLQAFPVNFDQLNEWLAEAIQVTRNLSVDLSPPILHGEGLLEAVVWLASQMEEQYGLEVNIRSEGTNGTTRKIDEKVRVLAFYAVRELLFNIVKHAGTLKAQVAFGQMESHLKVMVRDEGKGFDSRATMNNLGEAHGLLTLRHRLNLLGCTMEVNSQLGKGTEITIEVPYEQKDT